jgi:hypothetical protein
VRYKLGEKRDQLFLKRYLIPERLMEPLATAVIVAVPPRICSGKYGIYPALDLGGYILTILYELWRSNEYRFDRFQFPRNPNCPNLLLEIEKWFLEESGMFSLQMTFHLRELRNFVGFNSLRINDSMKALEPN